MLNKNVFAAVVFAVAASGAALADEVTRFTDTDTSVLSRASVVAELRAAQATGSLNLAGEQIAPVAQVAQQTSSVSRASVRAEAMQVARVHTVGELSVN